MYAKKVTLIALSLAYAHTALGYLVLSKVDFEAIEAQLQHESIADISEFSPDDGTLPTHKIKIITFKSGLKAIFKTGEYAYAEVAGYRLSKLLNLFFVPPTTFRTINKKLGSIQMYIPSRDLASVSDPAIYLKKIDKKTLCAVKFFYYLAGQWDTHYGNQLLEEIDNGYRLWLVDNSSMLHRSQSIYGKVAYIEKGIHEDIPHQNTPGPFPFHTARSVKGKEAAKIFDPYVSSSQLKALIRHHRSYIEWDSTLWIRCNTEKPGSFGRHTTTYVDSLLRNCQNLTKENLTSVWAEWLSIDAFSGNALIELTLKRRDELIAASLRGSIIRDNQLLLKPYKQR
jgi:hypothetical protein